MFPCLWSADFFRGFRVSGLLDFSKLSVSRVCCLFQSAVYRCVCRGVYVEVCVNVCVGLVLKQQGALGFNKLNHR